VIARLLSFAADLRDARQLARTVHVQAEQIDALTVLNEHLEEQLEVAETAAEEYRGRLDAMTAPVGDHVAAPHLPPGFAGQRGRILGEARDGAHVVRIAEYTFHDGSSVPYAELHETHDGARPGRVMALSALVHLAQNATDHEVWTIGDREKRPGTYTLGIEHSTAEIGEGLYRSWEAHAAHGGEPVAPARDAQALENRVLSLCQGWAADRERDTAARLNAAEVELAAAREALRQADAALTSEREGRRAAEQSWSRERTKVTALRSKLAEERAAHDMSRHLAGVNATEARAQIEGLRIGLEAAVERGRRWERHARALARTALMAVGMMGPARLVHVRRWLADIRAREGRDDTRPEHDAPPPSPPHLRPAPPPSTRQYSLLLRLSQSPETPGPASLYNCLACSTSTFSEPRPSTPLRL